MSMQKECLKLPLIINSRKNNDRVLNQIRSNNI